MSGYSRQKAADIVTGAVARASDIAAELDQVQAAFSSSTGHTHSGVSGEGAPITVLGPAQDIVITGSVLRPKTDNTVDLGTSLLEFKDGYFDGTIYGDGLNIDGTFTLNGTALTATFAELNALDGITASVAELNVLDGITSSTAELNVLDGITATTAELNYTDGVTSNIQTQLDAKANASITFTAGSGLTGGGDASTNRTFNVGAGDGISVAADSVAVDSTVVRTSGNQTIAGVKTYSNNAQFNGDVKVGDIDFSSTGVDGFRAQKLGTVTYQLLQCRAIELVTTPIVVHQRGTTPVYRVFADGDVVNSNNSYGALSDSRLKKNIEPASPQLDDIRDIEIVKYHLNEMDDEDPKHTGVIAQQLQEIKPGLVKEGQDGFLSVKYSVLVPLLIKAVQELADKVDALEAQIGG